MAAQNRHVTVVLEHVDIYSDSRRHPTTMGALVAVWLSVKIYKREVAGSNLGRALFVPRSTQPSRVGKWWRRYRRQRGNYELATKQKYGAIQEEEEAFILCRMNKAE